MFVAPPPRGGRRSVRGVCAALLLPLAGGLASAPQPGADVAEVFGRTARGEPLCLVALGGSITQAGGGWIGNWLREHFPDSAVRVVNAGVAGTNSGLGVFRLEQDVISQQPDLVFLEYCVNDGNLPDDQALRYMESLVVRLKTLPRPPAIVILEAAHKDGVNLERHRSVARHYGLLEVDLQAATEEHRKKTGVAWEALFTDAVHPSAAGHAVYARAIERRLAAFLPGKDPVMAPPAPLPPPLSRAPLFREGALLDLAALEGEKGWKREDALPFWWNRLFRGVLRSEPDAAVLQMTVRGGALGLFFPLHPDYGKMLVSVDGGFLVELSANSREGFTSVILADRLEEKEHVVAVRPVGGKRGSEPVKLGYLLAASTGPPASGRVPQGPYTAEVLSSLRYESLLSGAWKWSGPFGSAPPGATDGLPLLKQPFPPESSSAEGDAWKVSDGPETEWIAFPWSADAPAVVYATTQVSAAHDEELLLGVAADYYCEVWVNGESKVVLDGPHGSPHNKTFFPVKFRQGRNTLMIKLASGSQGCGFALSLIRSPRFAEDHRLIP